MKRFCKVILVVLLFAALALPVKAAGTPTLRASSAQGAPGGEVRVTVSLENTPGAICLDVQVKYDASRLTLKNVEDGGILGDSMFSPDKTKNPYTLSWVNDLAETNFTKNGVLATLVFTVASNAPAGETPITLKFVEKSALTADLKELSFTTVNGSVTISSSGAVTPTNTPASTDETPTNADETPTNAGETPDATDATPGATDEGPTLPPDELDDTDATPTDVLPGTVTGTPGPTDNTGSSDTWIYVAAGIVVAAAAAAVIVALIIRKKR